MAALNYPSRTAMVRNILREYRATDGVTGRNWYRDAYVTAAQFAAEYNVTIPQAIGVIAAISPQTQWWQNVMLAKQVLAAGAMVQGHTRDTMRKVNAILAGLDPLDVLGGQKVRSFYQNILEMGYGHETVTIDRHAWRTAMGSNDLGKRNSVPDAGYPLARDAYIRAAEIIGDITPAQLQAVVWVPRAA